MRDPSKSSGLTHHISVQDAAELVGYTADYVARLARAGKIDSKKVGARRLIDVESLKIFELEMRALKHRRQERLREERLREQWLAFQDKGVVYAKAPCIPSPLPAVLRSAVLFLFLVLGTMTFSANPWVLAAGAQSYLVFAETANMHVERSMTDLAERIADAHRSIRDTTILAGKYYDSAVTDLRKGAFRSTIAFLKRATEERHTVETRLAASYERTTNVVNEGGRMLYALMIDPSLKEHETPGTSASLSQTATVQNALHTRPFATMNLIMSNSFGSFLRPAGE